MFRELLWLFCSSFDIVLDFVQYMHLLSESNETLEANFLGDIWRKLNFLHWLHDILHPVDQIDEGSLMERV